ncbi:MAG: hypothetical protein GX556_09150 [Fibrobacter sp.]|nr:hypothetical protein [Fibrobacter sp.]
MLRSFGWLLFAVLIQFAVSSVDASEPVRDNKNSSKLKNSFQSRPYTSNQDIAFISVMGSRPDAKKLQGFRRAVLFNAQGEIVQKVDMGTDSIYSLDKMIQDNSKKGPLFIRMYRK